MNILEKIVEHKKQEVESLRTQVSQSALERTSGFLRTCYSLKDALDTNNSPGIIAEFKRRSPSRGWINKDGDVLSTVNTYKDAGAAGVSILTDNDFFGGSLEDLKTVRSEREVAIPILRKDFIIDELQVIQTKSSGADVMLLIAAALSAKAVFHLASKARSIGLEVILEIHTADEIDHVNEYIDIIGVNNRDLKTFEVDIHQSIQLASLIPPGITMISESGINNAKDVLLLKEHGFKGFLIGDKFMREQDPGKACIEFITSLS